MPEMHFVDAKGILNNNGMNIYRGCTHGCIYCDSRSLCYQFTHPFEDIEVKQNAPELLEKALSSKRKKCMIGTGSMSDPYMHCEKRTQGYGLLPGRHHDRRCSSTGKRQFSCDSNGSGDCRLREKRQIGLR